MGRIFVNLCIFLFLFFHEFCEFHYTLKENEKKRREQLFSEKFKKTNRMSRVLSYEIQYLVGLRK